MGNQVEAREILDMHTPSFLQTVYDTNFKLMVIRYAKDTNNGMPFRK
jgi:hypothetical protein